MCISTAMHKGFVVWLTGLPASGKTTIGDLLKNSFEEISMKVELLDGNTIRQYFSPELGFSKKDREINIRRIAYISHLLSRNGVIVIVSAISPYNSTRLEARRLIGNFAEVYVKCSLDTCKKRDPKGEYKLAMEGKISNFTGIHDPYEVPVNPEVVLDTETLEPSECVHQIINYLKRVGYLF